MLSVVYLHQMYCYKHQMYGYNHQMYWLQASDICYKHQVHVTSIRCMVASIRCMVTSIKCMVANTYATLYMLLFDAMTNVTLCRYMKCY